MGVFRRRTGSSAGVGAAGREQCRGKDCECSGDGSKAIIHCSLHLVRDNRNGTGSDIRYSMFPVDDSVRRLVVPEDKDAANFRQAQESITRCPKDQQKYLPVKKIATRKFRMALCHTAVQRQPNERPS
jgi:hypothetical protein